MILTKSSFGLWAGHKATLRQSPKSFGPDLPAHTHDWEVYVKGQGGADISQYIDKVRIWRIFGT